MRRTYILRYIIVTAALLVCRPLAAVAKTGTAGEAEFLLRVAEARAQNARSTADFETAAEAYRRAYESGARNSIVLGNMGTLLIHAKQRDAALAALLQAECLGGTTWELDTSLNTATTPVSPTDVPPTLPWYRIPLFWHYHLPAAERVTVALVGWCLLWAALAMRLLGWHRTARPILLLALCCIVLFGTSAFQSIHATARFTPAAPLAWEAQP